MPSFTQIFVYIFSEGGIKLLRPPASHRIKIFKCLADCGDYHTTYFLNSDLENGDDEMVWAEELLYGYEEDVQVGGVLVPPAQGQTVQNTVINTYGTLPVCVNHWTVNTQCDVIQDEGDNLISGHWYY